jgi:hypothetical protein
MIKIVRSAVSRWIVTPAAALLLARLVPAAALGSERGCDALWRSGCKGLR